jgi:hypothetical protein
MNEWYLLPPIVFALILHGRAETAWVTRVSALYMPIVIWAVAGNGLVVFLAQSAIVLFFAIETLEYLVQMRNVGITPIALKATGMA